MARHEGELALLKRLTAETRDQVRGDAVDKSGVSCGRERSGVCSGEITPRRPPTYPFTGTDGR